MIMRELLQEKEDREQRLNMLENELDHFQLALEERDIIISNLKEENEAILDQVMNEPDDNSRQDLNASELKAAKM